MAKDGTNRGGRRVRAGDKPQPLAEKITAGKAARVLEPPKLPPEPLLEAGELGGTADLFGEDMPAPSDYLSARQRDGKPLGADALFIETWKWLKDRGCEKFVNPRLIEAYAQAFTRYIQCEGYKRPSPGRLTGSRSGHRPVGHCERGPGLVLDGGVTDDPC